MMLNRKSRNKERVRRVQKYYHNIASSRKNEISKYVRDLKGKLVFTEFTCDICGHQHTKGYQYLDGTKEYMICEFCNNNMFHKHPYLKIQYTPLGNKR